MNLYKIKRFVGIERTIHDTFSNLRRKVKRQKAGYGGGVRDIMTKFIRCWLAANGGKVNSNPLSFLPK